MQSVAWEDLLLAHVDNVEDMWEVFKNELLNRIDTFIPKMNCFQQIKKDSWSRPLPPITYRKFFFKFWWNEELTALKESSIESNKAWKAAGKPRAGPIFDRRQACRLT